MQPESLDKIDTLAKIGASLVGVQIEAARIGPREIAGDPYLLGYCFGMFETMAQMAGLDQYSEGSEMMGAAFGKVVDQADAGPALFRVALDMKVDADFNEGSDEGGKEVIAWFADASAMPTGIARRAASRQ